MKWRAAIGCLCVSRTTVSTCEAHDLASPFPRQISRLSIPLFACSPPSLYVCPEANPHQSLLLRQVLLLLVLLRPFSPSISIIVIIISISHFPAFCSCSHYLESDVVHNAFTAAAVVDGGSERARLKERERAGGKEPWTDREGDCSGGNICRQRMTGTTGTAVNEIEEERLQ